MSAPDHQTKRERRDAAREERRQAEAAAEQAERRRKNLIRLGVLLAAAIAIVAVLVVVGQSGNDETEAPSTTADTTETVQLYQGIQQDKLVLGDPKAPVTMVEFLDMQCPFCGQYSREVMPTIVKDYVRTGKVRYEMRIMAFLGEDSQRAGEVADGASQQNRMYEFVDRFMRMQGEENSGYVTDDFLRQVGSGIPGLDIEKAMSAGTSALVERSEREAGIAGVNSTPSFLVGKTGKQLKRFEPGALDPSEFTARLDDELGNG